MRSYLIETVSTDGLSQLKQKVDSKTKPLGSLGILEDVAIKIGLIQQTTTPELINPHILVFAGDHGAAKSGVSPYPQEVTYQMVLNFISGGAAINVFAKENKIALKIIDAGVNFNFAKEVKGNEQVCTDDSRLIDAKINMGSRNYLNEKAMNLEELDLALERGEKIIDALEKTSNVVGFGEMGIGNTSSASIFLSLLAAIPLEMCVGAGAGHDKGGINKKLDILHTAVRRHQTMKTISTSGRWTPLEVMSTFGGYEMCMMAGAMLRAAEKRMLLLIDGFISSSVILWASKINPAILDYAIFSHLSDENAHSLMLKHLGAAATPLVNLRMRLGEGTGVAVVYPMIKSAVKFLNEMASFSSAGVSEKSQAPEGVM